MPDPEPTPTYTPLTWDQEGERFYETGVSNGVLYVYDQFPNPCFCGFAFLQGSVILGGFIYFIHNGGGYA